MMKVKVTFANGAIRSTKAKTDSDADVEAAIAKVTKYADGAAIVMVAVRA